MGNLCINTCCCEHNCIIFPAPRSRGGWDFKKLVLQGNKMGSTQVEVQLIKDFLNQDEQKVPFLRISNQSSRAKKQLIIYFHGNAEDIFHSIDFALPIFKSTQITILCLQYPTYSCYKTQKNYFISDRIKQDSVKFHQHIQKQYKLKSQNIYIIGRSIGSGPASYLASQVFCPKLVLISPFDTIRKVSMGLVGCIGFIIKNHFSNQEAILTHKGDLLVIHGRVDQVIKFKHGKALVEVYQNSSKKKSTFIQPGNMSHNGFDMQVDIVTPIAAFLSGRNFLHKNEFFRN